MSLEIKNSLDPLAISKLQNLIRANIDSYDGFQDSAEAIKNDAISRLFQEIAADRSLLTAELQEFVEWNGEEAAKEGSLAAGVYHAWISIRGKACSGDLYLILTEVERAEDRIKEAYEDVLKATAGNAMNNILMNQYKIVKLGYDRIRDLRDAYKPKN